MTRYVLLSCLLLLATSSRGDEKLATAIAPFVDDQTLAVLHVDLTRLDVTPVFAQIRQFEPTDKKLAALELSAKTILDQMTKAGLKEAFVVVSLADLPDSLPLFVIPMGKDADEKLLRMFVGLVDGEKTIKFEKKEGHLLIGSERTLNRVKMMKATPSPVLARAFASVEDSSARLVVFPNDIMRRAFEELAPTLPKEIGGGPTTQLTRDLRWMAVGASVAPKMEVAFTLQASNEAAAKTLRGTFEIVFQTLGKDKGIRDVYPDYDKLTAALLPKQSGDRLTVTVKQDQLTALFVPVVGKAQEAARLTQRMNNLKQIGLGFHTYHDDNKNFPAFASFDKQGKPLLSWRVHLLPYLGQEGLYKDFKLDEPWDSEHNKALIKRMPKLYASSSNPKLTEAGKTTYVVVIGPGTPFAEKKGLPLSKVTDGASLTILALDVDDERAVVWTKPEDLSVDLKNPSRGLRKVEGRGYQVLMMDGSVHLLSPSIIAKDLAARMTHAGGETINEK